jgi:hypothetical protein
MAILQPVSPDTIPPLGPGKDAQPEDRLWRELMLALAKRPIPNPTWPQLCSVHVYDRPTSRNWPPLSTATWYVADPDRVIDGRTAAQWWRDWSGWQLGSKSGPHRVRDTAAAEAWWKQWNDDPAHRDSGPEVLRVFGSDEVLSNTYDGMTIGSALAVLTTSRQRGDTVTAAAVSAFLAVWVAAAALASAAPSTAVHVHGLDGRGTPKLPQGLNLPAVVGIGARSTPNHAVADPRALLLAEMIAWPGARHPWPARDPWDFWFLQIAARCDGDFGLSPELTADARAVIQNNDVEAMDRLAADLAGTAWVGFEIRRWSDLVVGIMPECRNGNTAWVPASAARPNGVIELWFPWPKAKPGNLGSGRAEVDESGKLRVTSAFVKPAQPLPELQLPAEPPLRHWLFTREGFRLAGQPPAPGGTGGTGEPGKDKQPGGGPGGETPSVESRLAALEEQVRSLQAAVEALQQRG